MAEMLIAGEVNGHGAKAEWPTRNCRGPLTCGTLRVPGRVDPDEPMMLRQTLAVQRQPMGGLVISAALRYFTDSLNSLFSLLTSVYLPLST
jgi:hypothetical protein